MLIHRTVSYCALIIFLTKETAVTQLSGLCSIQFLYIPWFCDNTSSDLTIRLSHLSRIILDEDEINSAILNVIKEVVSYTLYTSTNSPGIEFNVQTYSSINLDTSKETKLLVHGWSNNRNSRMPQTLKDTYLSTKEVNVIVVDWSGLSNVILYPLPANGTFYIGECLSEMIELLFQRSSRLNIHILGHSLGAHVAGFAGRSLQRKMFSVPRITGLDPASPLIQNGLMQSDATFVDVIHTAAGTIGKRESLGHVDFYPNGGTSPQPGCSDLLNLIFCSHARSWQFFARSIQEPTKYPANQCRSYDDFLVNRCTRDPVYMGESTPPNSRGVYFLNASIN